jgi:hypothetical protein
MPERHEKGRSPNSPVARRATRWVLNDTQLSKRWCRPPRDTFGWDPLRPSTWRRISRLKSEASPAPSA